MYRIKIIQPEILLFIVLIVLNTPLHIHLARYIRQVTTILLASKIVEHSLS